jgi:hypothetical protein
MTEPFPYILYIPRLLSLEARFHSPDWSEIANRPDRHLQPEHKQPNQMAILACSQGRLADLGIFL